MALKIRTICLTSPPTCERARSSTSVVDLVTNLCLVACYAIGPLNKLIKKPYELYCVRALLAKLALKAAFRT